MALLFRNLSVLIEAGVSLPRALRLLSAEENNSELAAALRQIERAIDSGRPLWSAMADTRIFDTVAVELVRVGETSGRLAVVLARLAAWFERQMVLSMRTRSALIYPLFVMALCGAVVVLGPPFLLDEMFRSFTAMNTPIPRLTQILMTASAALRNPFVMVSVPLLVGLAFFSHRRMMTRPSWRRTQDRLLASVPVLGPCLREITTVSFVMSLELMHASAIPLFKALQYAAATSDSPLLEERAGAGAERLMNGASLAEALRSMDYFPTFLVDVVRTGEESGKLSKMLEHYAQLAEVSLEGRIQAALATLEPLALTFMGAVVAVVTLAVMGPLLGALEALSL